MSRTPNDLAAGTRPLDPRLFASLERAALDQTLAGIPIVSGPGGASAVLAQDPAALDAVTLPLARIANTLLPLWRLDALQVATLSRGLMAALPTFAGNVSNAQRILAGGGIELGAGHGPLDEQMRKRNLYASYRLLGMQVQNIGLDQRQITGAFLVFLVARVVTAIDRRFTDPKTTQAARDRLLASFGPALLELDDVLRAPQLRKEQLGAAREALAAQAEDAAADAELADAAMRLRQQLVLPREVLFSAARRFMQKGGAEGQPAAAPAPATGDGRIIR